MAWYDVLKPATSFDEYWDRAKKWGNPITAGKELLNAVGGSVYDDDEEEAIEGVQESMAQQQEKASKTYETAQWYNQQMRENIADIIGPESVEAYKQMVAGYDPMKYTASYQPISGFQFERDVSKYMDPNAQYQIDEAVKAAQQAMAGTGGMTGGAAARALQAEASQKAGELYGDAWERMMKATEQEYGRAWDEVTAEQFSRQQMRAGDEFKAGQLGNLFESYVGNLQGLTEDQINMLMARMGTEYNLAQTMANLELQKASLPEDWEKLLGAASQLGTAAGGAAAIFK